MGLEKWGSLKNDVVGNFRDMNFNLDLYSVIINNLFNIFEVSVLICKMEILSILLYCCKDYIRCIGY